MREVRDGLDGRNNIFIAEQDEILNETLAGVGR
jgi:hypothetical protein